ncbi:MAG TPA: hypothetical protein VJR89_05245, partial [Polyangiales bacterium]|nr:hypothetical protein [Polyangiales bacterium]
MRTGALIGCAALALAACAQAVKDSDQEAETGVLSLALTAQDSQGKTYRLRNAQFEVYGYPDYQYPAPQPPMGGFGYGGTGSSNYYYEQFKTEDDPDAEAIVAKLVPGYYNITLLNDDWYLERATDTGHERVEKAVLLTPRYQSTYVWDGGVAQVNYRFGVDGELLDFRSGELRIGIEIERPGERCVPGGGYAGWGYAGYPGMWPYPG